MSKTTGYILLLSQVRQHAFENNMYDNFGEPVPEFKHSRNIPLICFIINTETQITHIALGKRGNMAGTGMRRLNLNDIFPLETTVQVEQVLSESPK